MLKHSYIVRYKVYEFRLNSFQNVSSIPFIYPLFTPYHPNFGHKYEADFRGLRYVFISCFKNIIMRNFFSLLRACSGLLSRTPGLNYMNCEWKFQLTVNMKYPE